MTINTARARAPVYSPIENYLLFRDTYRRLNEKNSETVPIAFSVGP